MLMSVLQVITTAITWPTALIPPVAMNVPVQPVIPVMVSSRRPVVKTSTNVKMSSTIAI